jgi:lichenan operon transcriptional antiterminator
LRIHHLILERRPNYGIIINGSELNKRICLVNNLIKRSEFINVDESKDDKLKTIGNIILSVLHKTELRISEISLENLVSHIYVALHRSKMDAQQILMVTGLHNW